MSKLILLLVGLVVIVDAIVLFVILRRRGVDRNAAGAAGSDRAGYEPIDP